MTKPDSRKRSKSSTLREIILKVVYFENFDERVYSGKKKPLSCAKVYISPINKEWIQVIYKNQHANVCSLKIKYYICLKYILFFTYSKTYS